MDGHVITDCFFIKGCGAVVIMVSAFKNVILNYQVKSPCSFPHPPGNLFYGPGTAQKSIFLASVGDKTGTLDLAPGWREQEEFFPPQSTKTKVWPLQISTPHQHHPTQIHMTVQPGNA